MHAKFTAKKIIKKSIEKFGLSNIGKRLLLGVLWSISGGIVSGVLALFASVLIARILGQTIYGELSIIRSTVNTYAVFASFGLGITATKYISELRSFDKDRVGRIISLTVFFSLIIGTLIAFIILITAPYLASKGIKAPHLILELRIGAIMLLCIAINSSLTGILAGYELFKTIAKITLLSGVISFPIQIIFTYYGGITGSVLGLCFSYIAQLLLNFIYVIDLIKKEHISIKIKFIVKELPIIYKFSIPALLSGIIITPVIWVCNMILVRQENGFNELAIFDAANQWRTIILFVPLLLSKVSLPMLSNVSHDRNHFKKIMNINIALNLIFSFFLGSIIIIFSNSIMGSYGKEFTEGRSVLIILVITTILISINNIVGQAIASQGKMWLGFFLNFIWGILLISFALLFISYGFGALGLAISFFISYFFHTIIQYSVVVRKMIIH